MIEAPRSTGERFEELVEVIEARTGLAFGGHQHRRMTAAVHRGMAATRTASTDDYGRLVGSDPEVFADLADRLTVGETFFFRERRPLELVCDVLARRPARTPRGVRVWSAGCASGEEAYTLAMLLHLRLAAAPGPVQVLGTDIARRSVDRARAGVYGSWSLRGLDEHERARYFERSADRFRVREPFRRGVRFETMNLLDGPPAERSFDLVVCRNVLIYLTPAAVARVAVVLRDALAPGGHLVTGSSDPLLEIDGLDRVVGGGAPIYRRHQPTPGVVGANPQTQGAARDHAGAPGVPTGADTAADTDAPAVLVAAVPSPDALGPVGHVAGEPAPAGGADELVTAELDAEARFHAAVEHLDAGRFGDAATDAAAALYLDPDLAVAHLLAGAIADLDRRHTDARRSFRNAAGLLAGLDPDEIVPLAEEPAGPLAELAARRSGA